VEANFNRSGCFQWVGGGGGGEVGGAESTKHSERLLHSQLIIPKIILQAKIMQVLGS